MIDSVFLRCPARGIKTAGWGQSEGKALKQLGGGLVLEYADGYLALKGRLSGSRVLNLDDTVGTAVDARLGEVNALVGDAVQRRVDVRDWFAVQVDYCANLDTPYVADYLSIFRKAERALGSAVRADLSDKMGWSGSVYVKTNAGIRRNSKTGYTVNFYDKHDWAIKNNLPDDEIALAQNKLRLEAKCGSLVLERLAKDYGLTRFGSFVDYGLAYSIISKYYNLVIFGSEKSLYNSNLSFYSLQKAKSMVDRVGKDYLIYAGQCIGKGKIDKTRFRAGRQRVIDAGIYPYAFLPVQAAGALPCPLSLLRAKWSPYIPPMIGG